MILSRVLPAVVWQAVLRFFRTGLRIKMRLSIYRETLRSKWCWREVVDGCVVTHTVNVIGSREWGGWGVKLFCRIVVRCCKSIATFFRVITALSKANPSQASPLPASGGPHDPPC